MLALKISKMIKHQFLVVGTLAGALVCPSVWAVDQGDTVWVVDEAMPFRQPLGVEVTGTAILNPSSKNALPVQVLERKDIQRLGVHTAVALLQRLAVMVNSGDLGVSMLRPGPETAAIHGYEAGTLVLLNGRRLGIYPMQMVSANADLMLPDLGKVPLRAIERVATLMGDITRQSQQQTEQIRQLGAAIRITAPCRLSLGLGDGLGQLQQVGGWYALPLTDGDHLAAQPIGVGAGGTGEQAPAGPLRRAVELDQYRIHAIGAGAAHQTQHPHGHKKAPGHSPGA